MQAYNQAGLLVDEWKSEFMYHVYTCICPNNTYSSTPHLQPDWRSCPLRSFELEKTSSKQNQAEEVVSSRPEKQTEEVRHLNATESPHQQFTATVLNNFKRYGFKTNEQIHTLTSSMSFSSLAFCSCSSASRMPFLTTSVMFSKSCTRQKQVNSVIMLKMAS